MGKGNGPDETEASVDTGREQLSSKKDDSFSTNVHEYYEPFAERGGMEPQVEELSASPQGALRAFNRIVERRAGEVEPARHVFGNSSSRTSGLAVDREEREPTPNEFDQSFPAPDDRRIFDKFCSTLARTRAALQKRTPI